jgi:hypothetical protein
MKPEAWGRNYEVPQMKIYPGNIRNYKNKKTLLLSVSTFCTGAYLNMKNYVFKIHFI